MWYTRVVHGQVHVKSLYLCLRMKFGPRQHGKDWTKMRQRNHWWVRNDRKYTTAQIWRKVPEKVVNHKVANHSISLYVPYIGQIHWLQWINSEQNDWNTIETRIKNNRKRKEKQLNEWTMNVLPKSTKRHWQKWRGRRTLNQWYGSADSTEFDWKINQIETTALVLILLVIVYTHQRKRSKYMPESIQHPKFYSLYFHIVVGIGSDTTSTTNMSTTNTHFTYLQGLCSTLSSRWNSSSSSS